MWLDFDVRDNRRWTSSLEEVLLWITDSYFIWKRFKNALIMNLCLTNLQPFHFTRWTGVVLIIVLFLSAVWTLILTAPIHCRHPLLNKWCNAKFLQIWWRNKLIYTSDDLRVSTFSASFYFWVNCSFKRVFSESCDKQHFSQVCIERKRGQCLLHHRAILKIIIFSSSQDLNHVVKNLDHTISRWYSC